jgi:hypothetical protein
MLDPTLVQTIAMRVECRLVQRLDRNHRHHTRPSTGRYRPSQARRVEGEVLPGYRPYRPPSMPQRGGLGVYSSTGSRSWVRCDGDHRGDGQ